MLRELPQDAPAWTLRELVTWWRRGFGHRYASADRMERRLQRHVLAELGDLPKGAIQITNIPGHPDAEPAEKALGKKVPRG